MLNVFARSAHLANLCAAVEGCGEETAAQFEAGIGNS